VLDGVLGELRIARFIISALPLTHTGVVAPSNAISLPCSSASGAMNLGDLGAGALQIRHFRRVDRERLKLGDVEQLNRPPGS